MKGVLRDLRMEGSSISMETGPFPCGWWGDPLWAWRRPHSDREGTALYGGGGGILDYTIVS